MSTATTLFARRAAERATKPVPVPTSNTLQSPCPGMSAAHASAKNSLVKCHFGWKTDGKTIISKPLDVIRYSLLWSGGSAFHRKEYPHLAARLSALRKFGDACPLV